jgi:hypothetical protein
MPISVLRAARTPLHFPVFGASCMLVCPRNGGIMIRSSTSGFSPARRKPLPDTFLPIARGRQTQSSVFHNRQRWSFFGNAGVSCFTIPSEVISRTQSAWSTPRRNQTVFHEVVQVEANNSAAWVFCVGLVFVAFGHVHLSMFSTGILVFGVRARDARSKAGSTSDIAVAMAAACEDRCRTSAHTERCQHTRLI